MIFQPVKGTHDLFGEEMIGMQYVIDVLSATAELYAYKRISTPVLEYTEVFSRGTGGSSDIVRKEMYTFNDKGDRSVTMRPEFTAGVVRSVVSNKMYAEGGDLPLKLYYHGPAFRYERPQLGRYRQFHQFGVEEIGIDSPRADAECIIMAMQSLYMLGFKNLRLKINSIGDEESRNNYRNALKEYFSGKLDEMCEDCHERINLNPLRILDCKVPHDQEIAKGAPKIKDYLSEASESRFYETLSIINDLGIEYELDDSLVRGLDYYSEVVFEIHALSDAGVDYGALCGGGHYGGLVKQLGGPDLAGVGYAMGVERVYNVAKDDGLLSELDTGIDLYVIPVGEEVLDDVFNITEEIRSLGFSVDNPLVSGKLGSAFKKAERRGAKFALILGEDELERGVGQLKNLKTKEQKEIDLNDLENELDEAMKPFDEQEHHHHEEKE